MNISEKYKEFKIGNWVVNLPEGNYCTIQTLTPDIVLRGFLNSYPTTKECIGKIKITEDKLQVCGFTVELPLCYKRYNNEITVFVFIYKSGPNKLYKNQEEYCDVQYIHEVQNAYFDITGELLEGNLYGVQE